MSFGMPPFRLYGLIGCQHCVQAEQFLRAENVPFFVIAANDDPIADAGIKALTGASEAHYPVLVCTLGKQIVEGFKEDVYRKLADAYRTLAGTSAPNPVDSGQQPNGEVPAEVSEVAAGAN